MFSKIFLITTILFISVAVLFAASPVSAANNCQVGGVFKGTYTVSADCVCSGNCSPDDILKVVVNIMNLILGIVGSLMLLIFMDGAFWIILSGGSAEKIEKGKKTLINAVIGGLLVILAWFWISAVTGLLVKEKFKQKEKLRLETQQLIKTQEDNKK